MMKTENHPKGGKVEFDDKQHTYFYNGTRIKYSVTSLISKYWPSFDEEQALEFAIRKPEYKGYSKEQISKIWKNFGTSSAKFGTHVHQFAEEYMLKLINGSSLNIIPQDRRELQYFNVVREYIESTLLKLYDIVDIEKLFVWPELSLGGMADIVLRSKLTNKLVIADWKTNIKISDTGYVYGIGPLSNMEDCSLNRYTLQLNLYKIIAIKNGYYDHIDKMFLIHVTQDGCIEYNIENASKTALKLLVEEFK